MMLAVPAECSNYTVVAHRKEHERNESSGQSVRDEFSPSDHRQI